MYLCIIAISHWWFRTNYTDHMVSLSYLSFVAMAFNHFFTKSWSYIRLLLVHFIDIEFIQATFQINLCYINDRYRYSLVRSHIILIAFCKLFTSYAIFKNRYVNIFLPVKLKIAVMTKLPSSIWYPKWSLTENYVSYKSEQL